MAGALVVCNPGIIVAVRHMVILDLRLVWERPGPGDPSVFGLVPLTRQVEGVQGCQATGLFTLAVLRLMQLSPA